MYRPSFGRGRAGFGEFDAIVGTRHCVYLIESKWEGSTEIDLDDAQIRRHKIFKSYLRSWWDTPSSDWAAFDEKAGSEFHKTFPEEKKMARVDRDSLLARNLFFVLTQLAECGKETKYPQDILLFFHIHKDPTEATRIRIPDYFRFIPFPAEAVPNSMYIHLDIVPPDQEMAKAERGTA
jgi:hypothetical protein